MIPYSQTDDSFPYLHTDDSLTYSQTDDSLPHLRTLPMDCILCPRNTIASDFLKLPIKYNPSTYFSVSKIMCYLNALRQNLCVSLSIPSTCPSHLPILIPCVKSVTLEAARCALLFTRLSLPSLWRVNTLFRTLLCMVILLCATSCSILIRTSINNVLYILFFTFSYRKLLKWMLAIIFRIQSHLNLTHISGFYTLIIAVCGWSFALLNVNFIVNTTNS